MRHSRVQRRWTAPEHAEHRWSIGRRPITDDRRPSERTTQQGPAPSVAPAARRNGDRGLCGGRRGRPGERGDGGHVRLRGAHRGRRRCRQLHRDQPQRGRSAPGEQRRRRRRRWVPDRGQHDASRHRGQRRQRHRHPQRGQWGTAAGHGARGQRQRRRHRRIGCRHAPGPDRQRHPARTRRPRPSLRWQRQ